MVKRCRQAFEDYDDFKQVIQKWYSCKYQKEAMTKANEEYLLAIKDIEKQVRGHQ